MLDENWEVFGKKPLWLNLGYSPGLFPVRAEGNRFGIITDPADIIPKHFLNKGHAVAQLVEALRYKSEGRWFRFPMVSLEFFIDIILPAALWPWGRLSLLTEMSTRNISWG